jgi:hypothetical protein
MPTEDWERGYDAGYRAAHRTDVRDITLDRGKQTITSEQAMEDIHKILEPKKKRKASAYAKRYGREFKRIAPKYKLKRGGWAKDGFKRAQKAAHAATKKAMK